MNFQEHDFRLVEKVLLGGNRFNDNQKEFIKMFESKTIVAGPGTGKTTALAAKVVLLFKKLGVSYNQNAICIITHTNVAVEEINSALQRAGLGKVAHPHFIGTIHEFFNRFCVIPHFKKQYKHVSLLFDRKHTTDEEFYRLYLCKKYPWMKSSKYKRAKLSMPKRFCESELFFDSHSSSIDVANSKGWTNFDKYKGDILFAKLQRKSQGFLEYDDTFLFSHLYLKENRFKNMIRNRFKYIFLDEFQDTHPYGSKLLEDLFKTNNHVFQKVGDPYQTITYGQAMPITSTKETFRLNITNRFGVEIAKPLNTIMLETSIVTPTEKKSFTPIILLYDEEKEIYSWYIKFLQKCEEEEKDFKNSKLEDKVLVLRKRWAGKLKYNFTYKEKKTKISESKNIELKNLVCNYIFEEALNNGVNRVYLKEWINKHPNINELNAILLNYIKYGLTPDIQEYLINYINKVLQEKIEGYINNCEKLIRLLKSPSHISAVAEQETETKDDIFTIHAVKGESLRSVLLVDFEEHPLTNILLNKYKLEKNEDYSFTDLNLLYVAMSRVTHLFILAINRNQWKESYGEKLKKEWVIKDI